MFVEIVLVFVAYIIGSIPSGLLIARMSGVDDIRAHGSGNIGATNVARILGFKYFFIVFAIDCLRAFLFLKMAMAYGFSGSIVLVLAAALLIGNTASIFLNFSGGKGISTIFGILLALAPQVLLYVFCIWVLILLLTGTVGIASVVALISLPVVLWVTSAYQVSLFLMSFSVIGAFWALFLHRKNIYMFYKMYKHFNLNRFK